MHRFDLLDRRETSVDRTDCLDLDVSVVCSSGTYVRALARDLGAALGTAGHLTALRRTRVGPFGLDEAQPLTDDTAGLALIGMSEVARRCFPVLVVDAADEAAVRVGRALPDHPLAADRVALLSADDEFLALYRARGDTAVPEAVFCG